MRAHSPSRSRYKQMKGEVILVSWSCGINRVALRCVTSSNCEKERKIQQQQPERNNVFDAAYVLYIHHTSTNKPIPNEYTLGSATLPMWCRLIMKYIDHWACYTCSYWFTMWTDFVHSTANICASLHEILCRHLIRGWWITWLLFPMIRLFPSSC